MNRLASAALASAFLAATGGVALAANGPEGGASNPPAVQSTGSTAQAVRASDNSPTAQRMTRALNLLEAKGYADFHNFRPDGKNFDATVTRAGKQTTVQVDPDTDQITVQG